MKSYAVIETEVGIMGEISNPSKTWLTGYDTRHDAEKGMIKAFRLAIQSMGESLSYCHFDTDAGEARVYGDIIIRVIALKEILDEIGDKE